MKKSNVFIQRDLSSCGACSIQSIVSYYGGYVPLEVALEDTKTTKNGTNALELVTALKKYGFNSYGLKTDLNNIDKSILPVIAHTLDSGYEHFVVIYEIGSNIVVMDPKCGKKVYSMSDFQKIYSNVIITAIPCGKIVKYENTKTLRKILLCEFRKNYKRLILILILSVIYMMISFIQSFYIKLSQNNNILLITYTVSLAIIVKFVVIFFRGTFEEKLSLKLDKKLNITFLSHIFGLEVRYLYNKRVGELIKRINDMSYIKNFFISLCLSSSLDLLLLITSTFLLSLISIKLTIPVLINCLILLTTNILNSKKIYQKEMQAIDKYNEYYGDLEEYLSGIESIKNLNKETYFLKRIKNTYKMKNKKEYDVHHSNLILTCTKELITDTNLMLIYLIGILSVKNNSLSLVDLITFISIYSIQSNSFTNIISLIPGFIHIKGIFRGLSEFLDIKSNNDGISVNKINKVRVKDLSYSYDQVNKILKNVNFSINRGEKILIMGSSGSGKSTLAKCICSILQDYSGKVFINNIDAKTVSTKSLRDRIVYISQEEKLFTDTIKNNITLNIKDEKTYEKVIQYADVLDICKSKSEKDNSLVLEGGINLSGGQRARIILARALFKKPDILILDETLSSIPEYQENLILKKLLNMQDLTLLYITHRNKTKIFNKIIKLKGR